MNDLRKKICKVLDQHPKGLKGAEIALLLGVDKQAVNHFLTYDQTDFVQKSDYTWIRKATKLFHYNSDPVLAKLNNQSGAKTFTLEYFNSIADWSYCPSQSPDGPKDTYTTKTGNRIECDSTYEPMMLEYLENNQLVQAIGAQKLIVDCSSAFTAEMNYHPDLIFLTKDGYIAVVEVKALSAMSYHLNIEKYAALASFCEEKGFLYMMVDPAEDFFTYDDLLAVDIPNGLYNHVMWYLSEIIDEENPCLIEKSDFAVLYDALQEDYTKEDLRFYLRAIIVQEGWYNKSKHDFNVYKLPFNG